MKIMVNELKQKQNTNIKNCLQMKDTNNLQISNNKISIQNQEFINK